TSWLCRRKASSMSLHISASSSIARIRAISAPCSASQSAYASPTATLNIEELVGYSIGTSALPAPLNALCLLIRLERAAVLVQPAPKEGFETPASSIHCTLSRL